MKRKLLASIAAVTLLAVAATLGGSLPAAACSFAGPELRVPEEVAAGGAMVVSGIRFFTVEGSVEADCSGDYELVGATDVTITAVFQTASGERSVTVDAPPATGGDPEDFAVGPVEIAVPDDARSVEVTSRPRSQTVEVAVVLAPIASPPSPPPADFVPGEPDYTG